MSEINEGVRIVVERMKTNPEEFFEGSMSKWGHAVQLANGARWLTEEERKLLDDAADQVQRERFTAEVLKTLTRSEEDRARDAYVDAYTLGQGRNKVLKNVVPHTITASTTGIQSVPMGTVALSNGTSSETLSVNDLKELKQLIKK